MSNDEADKQLDCYIHRLRLVIDELSSHLKRYPLTPAEQISDLYVLRAHLSHALRSAKLRNDAGDGPERGPAAVAFLQWRLNDGVIEVSVFAADWQELIACQLMSRPNQ